MKIILILCLTLSSFALFGADAGVIITPKHINPFAPSSNSGASMGGLNSGREFGTQQKAGQVNKRASKNAAKKSDAKKERNAKTKSTNK